MFQELVIMQLWVIDQVWGQDSWILAKFFFCVFMDQDGGKYQAILTKQAWSIKDLLYMAFGENFLVGHGG